MAISVSNLIRCTCRSIQVDVIGLDLEMEKTGLPGTTMTQAELSNLRSNHLRNHDVSTEQGYCCGIFRGRVMRGSMTETAFFRDTLRIESTQSR